MEIADVLDSKKLLGPRNKETETVLDPRIPRKKTQEETENIAEYLVQKYSSPDHRPLFLKVAWRLSEARITSIVEASFSKGKNPRAYFIGSVKNDKAYKYNK